MRDNEKLNSSEQNEQNQTEAERVLGSMPSFEEHMQEIENEENNKDEKDNDIPIGEAALGQDIADIETIKDVKRSRKRDALNEAVNERMDKIEIAAQNGEHISNADRLFMFKQEGPNSAREGTGMETNVFEPDFGGRANEYRERVGRNFVWTNPSWPSEKFL